MNAVRKTKVMIFLNINTYVKPKFLSIFILLHDANTQSVINHIIKYSNGNSSLFIFRVISALVIYANSSLVFRSFNMT